MSIEENQKRKQTQLEFCFPDQKGIFSVLAERCRSIDSENKFANDVFSLHADSAVNNAQIHERELHCHGAPNQRLAKNESPCSESWNDEDCEKHFSQKLDDA